MNKKQINISTFGTLMLVLAACAGKNSNTEPATSISCTMTSICTPAVSANESAAIVPSTLHGTHNTTMTYATTSSPWPNGTTATFILNADNTLNVNIAGGTCLLLKNPVLRAASSVEYIFKDNCKTNVEFQISHGPSGSLNEVNIGPVGGGYIGQFR